MWGAEPAVFGYRKLTATHTVHGTTIPVPVSASPAILRGIGVVIASDDGWVRLWDQSLERLFWERRLDRNVYASLIVDHRRDRIIVASTSGLVCSLTLRGELAWAQNLQQPVFATPVVDAESLMVHIATFGSTCVGLALESGAIRYRTVVPAPWHAPHGLAAKRDIYSSPLVSSESNTIVCAGEHVIGLSSDGALLWSLDLGASIKASPVLVQDGSAVVVCAVDGHCWMLSARDGGVIHRTRLDGKVIASPAAVGGVLAIGVQGRGSYGLNEENLDVLWEAGWSPRSYTSFSELPNGDFLLLDQSGDAVGLSSVDGSFRWQSSQVLGLPDHEPAMDITPLAADDGWMYGASYAGDVYAFRFRSSSGESE